MAIADIWNRVIRETAITFTTREKTPEDVPLANTHVLASGERCLGFTNHAPFRAGPGYRFTHEITIYLDHTQCGQGHGDALLLPLFEECRAAGLHSLIAGLAGDNTRAFRFFARHGFKTVAEIPEAGEKFGHWHDLVLMQRMLA
ncbi:MAG: N-acetyltransferase family protein [Pseudomonadota bacterium]